ncbi:MAG: hypothetical protein AB8H80_22310 [Planctomycetota bacterium]
MQNPQSGAAHVPIMFFLILLVMFLGALGYGFVQQQDNTEMLKARKQAEADLQELKSKDTLISHYIGDIGKVISKPGTYEGREGVNPEFYNGATMTYDGIMAPKSIKELMDKAASDAGVATANSLENLLGSMITKVNAEKQRAQDAEIARDKALSDKQQADSALTKTGQEAADNSTENANNLEQLGSDFESAKNSKDATIGSLQQNVRSAKEDMTTAQEAATAREKDLKGQIALLKTQLSALTERQKLLLPPDVADGRMLVAKNGLPTAFINLGRKDLLQRGTVFRVKAPNATSVKGYCEVTRVEDERAEVRLYNFVDPVGDYAAEGDLLYNDLYTPRVTRTIFLMGRFGAPYGKEQVSNLLRRLGNRVVARMGPGVDTVVLGNRPVNEERDGFADIEESPEFKMANELRVEFTYLPRIADLIKL